MATHGDIGVSQPAGSTITMKVRTVTLDLNSTVTHQEVLTLGDAESTLGLARVIAAAPPSTTYGVAVRIASGPSSFADLPVQINAPSTANSSNYLPVRITDGTNFSTPAIDYTHDGAVTVSTVTGPAVLLRASAAAPSAVSADDDMVLQWALRNGAAVTALTDGNGALVATSSNAPSSASIGIVTRPVVSGMQTYAASTTGQSTATTLVSSAAGSKAFVYAYTLTSTASTGGVAAGFYDGTTLKWPVKLSSGFAGANLAVSPPAYLFAGSTGAPLTFNVESTVTGGVTLGVSYWVST